MLKQASKRLREHTTIKLWCKAHGFNYGTVVKVFNGFTGKRQIGVTLEIINQLRKDGYL